jgi:hypothetical protein
VAALRQLELWRQLREWPFALFLTALALSLWRAADQPSLDVAVGTTTASVVFTDVVLLALTATCAFSLARGRRIPRTARGAALSGASFALLLLVSGATTGAVGFVAAGKLVELGALSLGALVFVRDRAKLEALVDLLLLVIAAADAVAIFDFVRDGGGRQSSFLGEHDFAAIATVPLVYGVALLFERHASRRRAIAAIATGGLGVIFAAALASLLGFYLGIAALLVAVVAARRLDWRAVAGTLVVVVLVTGGTLGLRAGGGDLGFLQAWFGKPAQHPGQYAGGWSQRLIFVYVGGRVFLDHPIFGAGWHGNLPASEYARYLPDARRRFSDQPSRYFPPRVGEFIPQQAYDQVLYELGLVGGVLFAAVLLSLVVAGVRAASSAADRTAYLPAVWTAAALGAIAGEGLFGGTPLAALFWLTVGLVPAVAAIARTEAA